VNLDELRSVQSAERQSDALQHLRDGFYRDAGEYVQELREQRREAAEDAVDPYGDEEIRRLTDEIETAKNVTEAIWEARIGKILREASLSATDMSASAEGLTPEEAALFDRVVDAIEQNREAIQNALEDTESVPPSTVTAPGREEGGDSGASDDGGRPTPPDEPTPDAAPGSDGTGSGGPPRPDDPGSGSTATAGGPVSDSTAASTASADGDEGDLPGEAKTATSPSSGELPDEGSDGPADATRERVPEAGAADTASSPSDGEEDSAETGSPDGTDRIRVRITEDVGTIAGVDGRAYHLAADDVAELPDANARPLIERDAAVLLE
jgi:DNA replication factor GINS